jgi:hypothetical protein
MSRDWEAMFRQWSKPSSDTEQTKSDNAERMITDAIKGCPALRGRDVRVFAKGSYANNTNVRQESDVDIVVACRDPFFTEFVFADYGRDTVGLVDAPYSYDQFKNDVGAALIAKFGQTGVTRGKKAFDVHANTYRVDADVVPCFELRRYRKRSLLSIGYPYDLGTRFYSDDGQTIDNWPEQQYDNGVAKNDATGNRYKYMVRVLKRLRNEMVDASVSEAKPIPSYFIECLVWNAPNNCFGHDRYYDDLREVIRSVWLGTRTDDACREWGEVNELKYLFRPGQPWTRAAANTFLEAAWRYVGFS